MQMLYDSDSFVVVHVDANAVEEGQPPRDKRDGFEIVDKRDNTFVYLDGSFAAVFEKQVKAWQADTPTQEQVEAVLEGFSQIAHTPLRMQ